MGEKKLPRPTNDEKVLSKRRLSADEEGTSSRTLGKRGEQDIIRTIAELGKDLSDLEAEVAGADTADESDQLKETILHLKEEIVGYEKHLERAERRNVAERQRERKVPSEKSLAKYISSLEREIAGHEARLATRLRPGLANSVRNTISRLKKKLSWYLATLAGRMRRNGDNVDNDLSRKISELEREISWHEEQPLANALSRLDNEIMWHEGRRKIVPDSNNKPNGHSYGYQKSSGPLNWISSLFGSNPKPEEELAQSIADLETEIDWHEERLDGRKAGSRFSTGGTSESLANSITQLEKEIGWVEHVQDLQEDVIQQEQKLGERSDNINHHQLEQTQPKRESDEEVKRGLAFSISQLEKEVELQEQAQQLENEIGWHEKRLASKSRLGNANAEVITEVPETWTFSKRRGDIKESTKRQTKLSRRREEGEAGKITRSNFWKLPHFSTSSDTGTGRAFNWVGQGAQGLPS